MDSCGATGQNEAAVPFHIEQEPHLITRPRHYVLEKTWELQSYDILMNTYENGKALDSPQLQHPSDPAVMFYVKWFPNGNTAENRGHASLFLYMTGATAKREMRHVAGSFHVLTAVGPPALQLEFEMRKLHSPAQVGETDNWGWPRFATEEETKTWLQEGGRLMLKCRISVALPTAEHITPIASVNQMMVLCRSLLQLYRQQTLTDCRLIVDMNPGGSSSVDNDMLADIRPPIRIFACHRLILAANSPVLNAAFNHEMTETATSEVNINDLYPEAVQSMLEFMYGADLNVSDTSAWADLLAAAEKYQVIPLKELCEQRLIEKIALDNVCDLLITADTYRAQRLLDSSLDWLVRNQDTALTSKMWQDFSRRHHSVSAEILKSLLQKVRYH